MKTKFKTLLMGIALIGSITLVSCSKDDDISTPTGDIDVQLPMAPETDLPMAPDFEKEPQN